MLNLKGQRQDDSATMSDEHQQRLKQAFGSVLADQVMEGRILDQQRQLSSQQNNVIDDEIPQNRSRTDDEESSDIDFDEMDQELDKIQAQRRSEVSSLQHDNIVSPFVFFLL